MSFPATYNINYYQGDRFEFVIRPKTSAGEIYPVDSVEYDAFFYIDEQRGGTDGTGITASTSIDDNAITCVITPTVGVNLVPGTTYYYDVSIKDKTNPNIIYTLLTGTINVTADIASGA